MTDHPSRAASPFVDEVRIDGLLAQAGLRVGDQWHTAVITADAVTSLKLRRGDDAIAVIKSTEVMIARAAGDGAELKRTETGRGGAGRGRVGSRRRR